MSTFRIVKGFDPDSTGQSVLIRLFKESVNEILEPLNMAVKRFRIENGTVMFNIDDGEATELLRKELQKTGLTVDVVEKKFELFLSLIHEKNSAS